MSGLRLMQILHQQASFPLATRPVPVSGLLGYFKETGLGHQQAATSKVGDGKRAAGRPEWASVWADSVSAWHRAGCWTMAVPGNGVKSGWQSFFYLANLLDAKITLHCTWVAEKAVHPFHLNCILCPYIYSHGILISSWSHISPNRSWGCCCVAEPDLLIDKETQLYSRFLIKTLENSQNRTHNIG